MARLARGRPPHPRGVVATTDSSIPAELVLDTSFVFEALSPTNDNYRPCAAFLNRAAAEGTILYFNRLLEVELREAGMRAALKERWGSKWPKRVKDGRARRRARAGVAETVQAWDALVAANATVTIEIGEVADRLSHLMLNYGLRSYDAVHVATALYADVPALATLDPDFGLIPAEALELFVPPDRLAVVRSVRGGRFLRRRAR